MWGNIHVRKTYRIIISVIDIATILMLFLFFLSSLSVSILIYLNNTRNTTTAPTIFINISRNKYLPYLAYNETAPNQQLSNIEFYYELDNSSYPSGWLGMFFYEKLNYAILMSNSSTIIAMVQLPSSISPNSNMTIYMGFKRD